jgi:hypothetical protein
MTDRYMHLDPAMNQVYRMLGQTPTIPPPDVECLTANEAVVKYKPEVVIGAWVTQIGDGLNNTNPYGTNEEAILQSGAIYIHIGNLAPHGNKRILAQPHLVYQYPWLTGRGIDHSLNRIWVWNAKETK